MRTAFVAAVLLVVAAGCGERPEPLGKTVSSPAVTVKGAGDEPTALPKPPARIAVVGGTPTRILEGLGAGKLLVGKNLELLNGDPLVQELRRLRPDLIVGSNESDPNDLDRAAEGQHTPIYITPENSVQQIERATTDLGLLTGRAVTARRQVAAIQAAEARVAQKLAHTKAIRVFVDTGFYSTIGYRSLFGDMIREAKGTNVAGANPETGPFPLKQLVRLKPRFYLATSDAGRTLKMLRKAPKVKTLPAVRSGKFAIVPAEVVQGGPGVGAGIVTLAKLLHPDAFR